MKYNIGLRGDELLNQMNWQEFESWFYATKHADKTETRASKATG